MCKNWNNFCCLAILFLTMPILGRAQKADSVQLLKQRTFSIQPQIFNKYNHLQAVSEKEKLQKPNLGSPFAHWGFMCVGEYKLEQKTGIPLRVRLGSLDYVNKLEGKR
jgi:hypothetical protein